MTRRLSLLGAALLTWGAPQAKGDIAATHVYHNHMPNFWAYYDTDQLDGLATGAPITYTWDAYVINLKASPPASYPYYLPDGQPMPHDDLVSYYSHHAKQGAYMSWPWDTAAQNNGAHPQSQTHVTMSGSVVSNVQSLNTLQNVSGYNNPNWGDPWESTYNGVRTSGGHRALDLIHFTGHHTMGPLVGESYFLKELIYHGAMLAQPFFLGESYRASKGFFPTELGFSERLIPTLRKMGIEWSVLGNVHYSRTLSDYPYLDQPGVDTLTSPPNRADLQNTSEIGDWVSIQMFNEAQVTHNKFPFASIPHWVRYVDPETGEVSQVAGIPVEQASSWEEGYQGSVTAAPLKPFEDEAASLGRTQYFVVAHDGDNSQGRAGDGGTWLNSGRVTYSDAGVTGKGVDEYLAQHPIPPGDVVHVQDGSWIDTRDSSADPTWYHWHLPFGIWKGQFADFNRAMGTDYAPKRNLAGVEEGMTVSLEYGYHYLERNFALLQAALNYAETAEQIWLDGHPNHWRPQSTLDRQITFEGNQLNPWMLSFPVKGDPSRDWAGGANPAELAWYFLLPALDSGFGYYDENVDDHVKPTLAFNQSLEVSQAFVTQRISQDETGPSVWWPQRYPYNPGSANVSKAEGWTLQHFDTTFALYTYAFDASGIETLEIKVRAHRDRTIDPLDKSCRVYDPEALAADPQVDPDAVGPWVSVPVTRRDLTPDMNGVPWQPSTAETMAILPAQAIGDLYFAYVEGYQDQLLDYYVEATDGRGNVTRSAIQQVFVGAGRYRQGAGGYVEDGAGPVQGIHPFITDVPPQAQISLYLEGVGSEAVEVQGRLEGASWETMTTITGGPTLGDFFQGRIAYPADEAGIDVRYRADGGAWIPGLQGVSLSEGTYTLYADGSVAEGAPEGLSLTATVYYQTPWTSPYMHHRPEGGTWTTLPGDAMGPSEVPGFAVLSVDLGAASALEAVFNNGSGVWDNNGGQNYRFPPGVSTLSQGVITPGAPEATEPGDAQFVTLYYTKGFPSPYLHFRQASGVWTTPPGEAMATSEAPGYHVAIVDVGDLGSLEAVFNDGAGTWDNNSGQNYRFSLGVSTFDGGDIAAGAPVPTGACCAGDGCFVTTAEACDLVGGDFNGEMPTPTEVPTPSPTPTQATTPTESPTETPTPSEDAGACCQGDACDTLPFVACLESGGDFLGPDVSCEDDPCGGAGCQSAPRTGGDAIPRGMLLLLGLLGFVALRPRLLRSTRTT